jgi:hypothetical protein
VSERDDEVTEGQEQELAVFIPRGLRVSKEHRRQVILALRGLSWHKRLFLRFLAEAHWHTGNAYKAMIAYRGDKFVGRSTVSKWSRNAEFMKVVQMLRALDPLRQEATDPDRILIDHRAIADYGLEIVEVTSAKTGKKTRRMRNPMTALAALDKLGKHKKLWGTEEQTARIVLDIVDLTGPAKLVDVTPVIEGEVTDGGDNQ